MRDTRARTLPANGCGVYAFVLNSEVSFPQRSGISLHKSYILWNETARFESAPASGKK